MSNDSFDFIDFQRLDGHVLDAAEAHRIGLVNFVTPDDECVDQAVAYARRIAAKAPMAVQCTKGGGQQAPQGRCQHGVRRRRTPAEAHSGLREPLGG